MKQTMYIAPKSTNESRAHYSPEPARGAKTAEPIEMTFGLRMEVHIDTPPGEYHETVHKRR